MISLQNIGLTYNDKKIFDHISWLITEKSRIGLVGDNGAGKTTLFRAIKGEVSLDSGTIEIPKNKRIGYLPQDLVELDPLPVMDYLKRRTGQEELEKNIHNYEEKIASNDHRQAGLRADPEKIRRRQRSLPRSGRLRLRCPGPAHPQGPGFCQRRLTRKTAGNFPAAGK